MFLVDSNVLIEAKNRYYGFDIAPGFWSWLEQAHARSMVCSIENVRDELTAGGDELSAWARTNQGFFRPIDATAITHFAPVAQWAQSGFYTPAAVNEFVGNAADFYLVAYARAHNHVLVTHEVSRPDSAKRVRIPDACMALGVTYKNTFSMLRESKVKLDLQA